MIDVKDAPGRTRNGQHGHTDPLRVAVADDHLVFAQGLAGWLGDLGVAVTGVAQSAAGLRAIVEADPPDVVTVDVSMGERRDEGIRFAEELDATHPEVGVLVVTAFRDASWAERLFAYRQQGVGYLLKESIDDPATLLHSLTMVSRGELVTDPRVVVDLAARRREQGPYGEISPRELEVLREMAAGRSNTGVASALTISTRTVENHIRRIFDKLALGDDPDAHARVRAVLWFQQRWGSRESSAGRGVGR
jgi:DNA-binding NarL/FixJ family response regulator